jgi:peptidoglycan-associated lipoprotein
MKWLPSSRRLALVGLVAAAMLVSGCSRKAAEAPPAPPPAPPTEPTPPPPVEPAPTPPAPAPTPAPTLSSGDFQPAFFDFDSYTLRDDARSALDSNARLLRDNATVRIVIEGHCDERGTAEYNQALGERRAQAARSYLEQAGITGDRLQVVSYGKERPFDPGHDEAAWAKNRRAHFVLQ